MGILLAVSNFLAFLPNTAGPMTCTHVGIVLEVEGHAGPGRGVAVEMHDDPYTPKPVERTG